MDETGNGWVSGGEADLEQTEPEPAGARVAKPGPRARLRHPVDVAPRRTETSQQPWG